MCSSTCFSAHYELQQTAYNVPWFYSIVHLLWVIVEVIEEMEKKQQESDEHRKNFLLTPFELSHEFSNQNLVSNIFCSWNSLQLTSFLACYLCWSKIRILDWSYSWFFTGKKSLILVRILKSNMKIIFISTNVSIIVSCIFVWNNNIYLLVDMERRFWSR